MVYETNALVLKELEESDFNAYQSMLSETVCHLLGIESKADELWYLSQQVVKVENKQTLFLCIFEKKSHTLIGAIEIRDQSYRSQLYNWIHELFWSNGYYQEALQAALDLYFTMHPEEIEVNALVEIMNKRSFYALKKAGFVLRGKRKGPRMEQYDMVFYQNACKLKN